MTIDSSSQKPLKQDGLSAISADIKIRTKERTSGHPHPYLNGNFYPVFEETVGDEGIECEVVGTIPEVLRGSQYIRTGPNTLNVPADGAPHHFFTGEGKKEQRKGSYVRVIFFSPLSFFLFVRSCCLFEKSEPKREFFCVEIWLPRAHALVFVCLFVILIFMSAVNCARII